MLEAWTASSRLMSNRDRFGFVVLVGDGEGSAAEFLKSGPGYPQGFAEGDDGEAFLSSALTPLPREGVGGAPADPEDLGGFLDGEKVRQSRCVSSHFTLSHR